MNNFPSISWRKQVTFDGIMSNLYETNTLSWIFIVLLPQWNNSQQVDMSLHFGHIIRIMSQPVSSYSWMLLRSRRYQFYSSWSDPIEARTHDLPNSRHESQALYHRGSSHNIIPLAAMYPITLIRISIRANKNLPPRYNWNIVESGIKHHNPNPIYLLSC